MDGILIIDKPAGITSHDVVARVRRILKTRRVGHTGTLDPFATGVMVVLVGRTTRLAQFLDKDEKEYVAKVRFGFETDTGDRTGSSKFEVPSSKLVSPEDVEAVLPGFRGEIEQVPPMYSAKKVDGKKLYEHARKGETIKRKAVAITISELEITGPVQAENLEPGIWNLELRVVCSAGTYIRTLAEDIGRAVGVGAHLSELRRTRAGRFDLTQSVALDDIKQGDMLPIERAVEHLPSFELAEDRVERTVSGLSTRIANKGFIDGEAVRMLSLDGRLLAVGVYEGSESSLRPKVVLG